MTEGITDAALKAAEDISEMVPNVMGQRLSSNNWRGSWRSCPWQRLRSHSR